MLRSSVFRVTGGFGHVWSEMETSRRMKLPVVLVVLNNQILGYQKHAELSFFGGYTDVCDFEAVDHAAIARACGCAGVRIEKPADFLPALTEALGRDTLTVIDVVTDQRAYPPITGFEGKDALNYYRPTSRHKSAGNIFWEGNMRLSSLWKVALAALLLRHRPRGRMWSSVRCIRSAASLPCSEGKRPRS